jgi:hypothetical protein
MQYLENKPVKEINPLGLNLDVARNLKLHWLPNIVNLLKHDLIEQI